MFTAYCNVTVFVALVSIDLNLQFTVYMHVLLFNFYYALP